jgi:hypothetical protein
MKKAEAKKTMPTRTLLLTCILTLSLMMDTSYAVNNSECSKPNKTKNTKGVKFKCVKNGEKLVWADKKTRKKIASQIKKEIEAKKRESVQPIKDPEISVEPPKNQILDEKEFKFSNYSERDFRKFRSEGFETVKELQAEYLRYNQIYKFQNEKSLSDYRNVLKDVEKSGWLDYYKWEAQENLGLTGDAYTDYLEKAKDRVTSQVKEGIQSILEAEEYYRSFNKMLEENINYFRINDANFNESVLRQALIEAEQLANQDFLEYKKQLEIQERDYQGYVAEELRYKQEESTRFNQIYKKQYEQSIAYVNSVLNDVDKAGYLEDAKWIAKYELSLTGSKYEEYLDNARRKVEESLQAEIDSYQSTISAYMSYEKEIQEKIEYLRNSEYEFSEELLNNAINQAKVNAERDYQTYLSEQIKYEQREVLVFKSVYEAEYKSRLTEYLERIQNVDQSEYIVSETEYARDSLGLSGAELDNYVNRVRSEYVNDLESQADFYQSTIDEYSQREAQVNEGIEYLNESEYEFSDQLLEDAIQTAQNEADATAQAILEQQQAEQQQAEQQQAEQQQAEQQQAEQQQAEQQQAEQQQAEQQQAEQQQEPAP